MDFKMGMASFGSLLQAAAHFAAVNIDLKHIEHAVIVEACKMVQKAAKEVMGTDGYNWPALSPNTKKTMPGMLLESGELRSSIHWNVQGAEGHVGSDLDKAVWMELGTRAIPPRSFLVGAAQHQERAIQLMAGKVVVAIIGGGGHSELDEFLHVLKILKHVAHDLKDFAEDVLEGPDKDNEGKNR
jgi:hypothetical protein